MTPSNIFILEDSKNHFDKIKKILLKEFKINITSDNIFPSSTSPWHNTDIFGIDVNNPLRTELDYIIRSFEIYKSDTNKYNLNELFEHIINIYNDVDLFLIDVKLTLSDDKCGLKFYDFVKNKGYKCLLLTSFEYYDININKDNVVPKSQIFNQLIKKIKSL